MSAHFGSRIVLHGERGECVSFSAAIIRLTILVVLAMTPSALGQGRPPLQPAIDNSGLTVIRNSVHPRATPANDRGPIDGAVRMERMLLVLTPDADRQFDLQTLIDSQQDKTSASFRHWLTPEQFGAQYGVAQED